MMKQVGDRIALTRRRGSYMLNANCVIDCLGKFKSNVKTKKKIYSSFSETYDHNLSILIQGMLFEQKIDKSLTSINRKNLQFLFDRRMINPDHPGRIATANRAHEPRKGFFSQS